MKRNRRLCRKFKKITGGTGNVYEALEALKEKSPGLYRFVSNMGRPKKAYRAPGKIKARL
jgi:hypothetical protein